MSKSIYHPSVCQECNYEYYGSGKRFCSLKCQTANKARNEARRADEQYLLNPKLCKQCQCIIPRKKARRAKFCSHSCRASHNNVGIHRNGKSITQLCPICQNKINHCHHQYCSDACEVIAHHARQLERIKRGEISKRTTIRSHLIRAFSHHCWICKNIEWMGKPIPLDLDHIDGNAGDNRLENLQMCCPNCHAQQPTRRGGNWGKGRGSRGLSLA